MPRRPEPGQRACDPGRARRTACTAAGSASSPPAYGRARRARGLQYTRPSSGMGRGRPTARTRGGRRRSLIVVSGLVARSGVIDGRHGNVRLARDMARSGRRLRSWVERTPQSSELAGIVEQHRAVFRAQRQMGFAVRGRRAVAGPEGAGLGVHAGPSLHRGRSGAKAAEAGESRGLRSRCGAPLRRTSGHASQP